MSILNVAFGTQIAVAAERHHLDPRLLAAVAAQETGGPASNSGRNIVGDGGHGRGLFQIDDRWHPFAQTPAAMDPGANADYAAGLLSRLIARNGGNVHAALSSYNAGSPQATGTRTTWGDGSILGYADSVLRHYQRLVGHDSAPSAARASPRDAQLALLADTDDRTNALQALFTQLGMRSSSCPSAGTAPHKHSPPPTDPDPGKSIVAPGDDADSDTEVVFGALPRGATS